MKSFSCLIIAVLSVSIYFEDVQANVVSGHQHTRVKRKFYMETWFNLGSDGMLNARTKTWSRRKLQGFTGGVFIVLTDSAKNILWVSKQHRYGVNGKWLGKSKRTETWSEQVPSSILSSVKGYSVVHEHTPTYRFLNKIKKLVGKQLKNLAIKYFTGVITG